MAMWAQVVDTVVTSVIPDGTTSTDIYATFTFSGDALPEGAVVKFVVGKGTLPPASETTDTGTLFRRYSLQTITDSISPIEGISLVSDTGVVENIVVKDASAGDTEKLVVRAVAKATLKPVIDPLENTITVVAYSTYDAIGTAKRFIPQSISLTIQMPKEEVDKGTVGTFLAATQRYNTTTNAWEVMAASKEGRSGPFCQEISGKVYLTGGLNGGYSSTTEEYDTSTDAWSDKAALPVGRAFGMSESVGGKMYVIGGYNESDGRAVAMVHRYDPGLDSWTRVSDMPLPVAFGSSCVIGGKIYVLLGGSAFSENSGKEVIDRFNKSVFSYDTGLDEWTVEDVVVAGAASTTLQADATAGDASIAIGTNVAFPSYGTLTIDRGGANQETVTYYSHNAARGEILLDSPLALSHLAAEAVVLATLPESRLGAGAVANGNVINVLYGIRYAGQNSKSATTIRSSIVEYDVSTKAATTATVSSYPTGCSGPCLPRYRYGYAVKGGSLYVMGGTSDENSWQNKTEVFDPSASSITGPDGYEVMPFVVMSPGAASYGDYVYVFGGAGSGQAPGWLSIDAYITPERIRADGLQTASVVISSVDAAGDPPPDGVKARVRGIIYVKLTKDEAAAVQTQAEAQQAQGAVQTATSAPLPPQSTSILPVVFSDTVVEFKDGEAVTTLLPRSEDPITQADNLFNYAKSNEVAPSAESLKNALDPEARRNVTQTVGEKRSLYNLSVEVVVEDAYYNGRSDTNAAISDKTVEQPDPLSFSVNPGPASQKRSATAEYYSDITSIPDVSVVVEGADAADAKTALETMREDIPFGASPYYDALLKGIRLRNDDSSGATNIMVAASDNDQSYSTSSPSDVVNEANAVDGAYKFPIFITNFVVTKPVSLSARRSRTDVRDLEYISEGTGGNSFSVVDSSYVQFVIDRIKTSAPSSIGSGSITIKHDLGGPLVAAYYAVTGLEGYGGPDGNTATMTIWYSLDDYNYTQYPLSIPPNVAYTFDEPIVANYVKYQVSLRSTSFVSPVLTYVAIDFVEPSVQYLFTYPQAVAGQVSELASVVNYRLPAGGSSLVGVYHGESFVFDRDYVGVTQPGTGDRGTIHVINRAFNAALDDEGHTTDEVMDTEDFVLYRARSGPWSQEAVIYVYLNGVEVLPEQYISIPERGVLAFRRRLSPKDLVTMEVQNPSTFRVGIKMSNPSSNPNATRVLDSFAFMYGNSVDELGVGYNSPPRAVNLFITPSPAQPGGPLVANYTFVDPEGDDEDRTKTQITWYRNGAPVSELANKWMVSNSDIASKRSDVGADQFIARSQEWFFTVRPSDGKSYGPLASSPKVVIANIPPSVSKVTLVSSNTASGADAFTSSDTITVNYTFTDIDGDKPSGMVFTWYSGGLEVKTGSEAKLLPEDKDAQGNKVIVPGATIRCDVSPSDGSDYGPTVSSQTITVTGSTPTAEDVAIVPTAPSSVSNLKLSYRYIDVDGLADQSRVAWYKNGERITALDDSHGVASSYMIPGQQWYAVVTPYNGSVSGKAVKSNVVVVQF